MKINRTIIFSAAIGFVLLIAIILVYFIVLTKSESMPTSSHPKLKPNDWMAMQRTYPYSRINPEAVLAATNQVKQMMDNKVRMTTPWVQTGPTNIGGRITDVELPPDDMNTIYLGASTGGVLKSTDFGQSWVNLFGNIPVVSIGDIAIDPNNTSTFMSAPVKPTLPASHSGVMGCTNLLMPGKPGSISGWRTRPILQG